MTYDVVIVGGGPAGLAAALTLGRARKRVLLCDAGPARNAAAVHVHNFVTRDGITPAEFRRVAREQLASYPNVATQDARVDAIAGARDAFEIRLSIGSAQRRSRRFTASSRANSPVSMPAGRRTSNPSATRSPGVPSRHSCSPSPRSPWSSSRPA